MKVEVQYLAGDGTQAFDRFDSPGKPSQQRFPDGSGIVTLRDVDRKPIGGAIYSKVVALRWGRRSRGVEVTDQERTGEEGWLGACGSSACIQVRHAGPVVHIRTSAGNSPVLTASRDEWDAFIAAVHEGRIA